MMLLAPFVGVQLNIFNFVGAIFVMFLIAFAMTAFGIVIAARMKEMEGFQMVVNFIIMPIFFISGALFPLDKLPPWLSLLTKLDPLTYGVDLMRAVLINFHAFPEMLSIVLLLLISVVFMGIAVLEFNVAE
jgi:ABC-2 type transport system permease protein